jgi:serine phosphatase RsbU (regulator of sigma subunit)
LKVSPFKSISAKLFYYMGALVLVTVAGNSFQFLKSYQEQRRSEAQDSMQMQAEQAQGQIESTFENWRSLIAVGLPTLTDVAGSNVAIQRLVDSNSEFVSLQLFKAPTMKSTKIVALGQAFTEEVEDTRFEDQSPTKVKQRLEKTTLSWLKKRIPKTSKKNNTAVDSLGKSLKLPIVLMAMRFDTPGGEAVWAVLAAWQTTLIKVLPKSQFVNSAVVDANGNIFSAPDIFDMVQAKRFDGEPLVKAAISGNSPSGFEADYKVKKGGSRLGAFARVPRYDLAVLIEHDADKINKDIQKSLLPILLWATLFVLLSVMMSYIGAARITDGLRKVTYATSRIAAGDFNFRLKPASEDEVGALSVSVNHMSNKIVGLMQSQVDKARFEKELETAKMVQSTFFPRGEIRVGALHITGFYQPASECGGDLWGHCKMEDGLDFVFVADAMGHGAPAALVTAMAYSTTMTVTDIMRDNPNLRDSPAKILDRMNRIIYEAVRGTISMTFFAAIIDTRSGKITFANAGHNFPLIIPAKSDDDRAGKQPKALAKISDINPISLKLMGTPLGMEPTTVYKDQTMKLKAGDKLFMFTDGLIECTSPDGKVWGRKFLIEQLCAVGKLPAEELKTDLLSRAFGFFANQPLADDVTVAVLEIDAKWQPKAEPQPQPVQAPAATTAPQARTMPPMPPPAARPPMPQAQPVAARPSTPATQTSAPIAHAHAPAAVKPPMPKAAPVQAGPAPAAAKPQAQAQPQAPAQPQHFALKSPTPQAQPAAPAPAPKTAAPAPAAPASQPAQAPASGGKYKIKLPSAG